MDVQFSGTASDRDDVQHVSAKSDGTVVLRFSDHKEYVDGDDHLGYTVVESR